MNNALIGAQDVFLNKINTVCKKFGLNHIMAQLYAVLYFSSKPMSLNDMMERLKISKASASINIRALERYGAVRRVWVKGSRKDYYESDGDIYKVIGDRARSMAKGRLSDVESMINSSYEALSAIGSAEDESVKLFKEKLDRLKTFYDKAQGFFDLFNAGLLATLASASQESSGENFSYITGVNEMAHKK